jgi:murein DD-endopeptidase MepM/ murein hydrolase activator NlpD
VVVRVVNDIEDNIPYSGNYQYNTGNTVVIKNGDYYLLAGHLKKGSITVIPVDTVKAKDNLGESGNSGMSERPHLHMQLIRCDGYDYLKGPGISMQFRGRNFYKNRLIRN